MAGLLTDLIGVLHAESEHYEDLSALAEEKKGVIIQNDLDALKKITALENTLVSRALRLEKKRAALMADIATVLGRDAPLTLTALLELIRQQAEHPALQDACARVRAAAAALREANALNKELVERSLEYIQFSLNLFCGAAEGAPSFYDAGPENGPALFDVRQ